MMTTSVHRSSPPERPPILLTGQDRELLLKLLHVSGSAFGPEATRFLREEIERAEPAPEAAANLVVGLNCEVLFIDHQASCVRLYRIVLPDQATGSHCLSVLSPIGSALIGLGPGQSINWLDHGVELAVTVLEVRRIGAQPEGARSHSQRPSAKQPGPNG